MKKIELKTVKEDGVDAVRYELLGNEEYDERIADKVNQLSNVLPFEFTNQDDKRIITTYVRDTYNLEAVLSKTLQKREVLCLLSELASVYDIGAQGVPVSYVVKDFNHIYVNEETLTIKCILVPVKQEAIALNEIPEFFRTVVSRMSFDEIDMDNYVAKILTIINSNDFSTSKLKTYIDDELEKMGLFISKEKGVVSVNAGGAGGQTKDVKVNRLGVINNMQNSQPHMMGQTPYGMPPQNMNQQGMPPQGARPNNVPPMMGQMQGQRPQGMPPQGINPQAQPPQGMPPQGINPQAQPPQGARPNNVPPMMGQMQGQRPQGMPPQGINPQVQPPQGMPPQGINPQAQPPQGARPNNVPPMMGQMPQGQRPQGMPPQGINPQAQPPQGMPPQGINPQAQPPQGVRPNNVPPMMGQMPQGQRPQGMPPQGINPQAQPPQIKPEEPKPIETPEIKSEEPKPTDVSTPEQPAPTSTTELKQDEPVPNPVQSTPVQPTPAPTPIQTIPAQSTPVQQPQVQQPPANDSQTPSPQANVAVPSMMGGLAGQLGEKPIPHLVRKKTGEVINITKPEFAIGKSQTNADYTIEENPAISRVHCIIVQKNGVNYIKDNNSTNHTYINDEELEPQKEVLLKHKTVIRMGDEEFTFLLRKE